MSEHICDFPRVTQTGRECPYCTIRELEQQLAALRELRKRDESEFIARADANAKREIEDLARITELEQQLTALRAHSELLREAADMTILKHRIRMEKGSLVWFDMPSEEMEKLGALLQERKE